MTVWLEVFYLNFSLESREIVYIDRLYKYLILYSLVDLLV